MKLPIKKKKMIITERLTLHPTSEQDIEGLVSLLTNEEITKTFMVPKYETDEEYAALARKLVEFSRIEDTVHLEYGIYLQGKIIGFINDCGIDEDTIEIGYVIHPDYKGNGYATEAVKAVIEDLRDMGFRKVKAGYFEENPASCRVMEKSGMHKTDEEDEEEYRGTVHRCLYCEILL